MQTLFHFCKYKIEILSYAQRKFVDSGNIKGKYLFKKVTLITRFKIINIFFI